jgi:membrane fusion protein (multidrug efflux system)
VVEARPAERGTVAEEIEAVGSLRSDESVDIRAEAAGRVVFIGFAEGSAVTRGTLMVALDDSVPLAQLEQAKASLALSRSNHQRAEELIRTDAASARSRDEAVAKLKMDEAAVRLAEAVSQRMKIHAPHDGIVGLRRVGIGDFVEPGDAIVNLEKIDLIKVDFRVPEIFAPAVRPGQSILLNVDALPGQNFVGTVFAIDPRIDGNGRNMLVRATVPNPERTLLPGMFARVALTLRLRDGAILVPEEAIVSGSKPSVFRVVDGKAKRTPVVLGIRRKGIVELREGITPGEWVVTAGQMKLTDGAAVTITAPPVEREKSGREKSEREKGG